MPLETTERIEMRPEHLRRLGEAAGAPEPELVLPEQPEGQRSLSGNPLVACLSDALRFYMEFHRLYDQGYVAHVHDAFAACAAAGRTPFATRLATVDVETDSPLLIGTTVADFRGLWGLPPNARIVSDNNPGQCFDELISSVGALARAVGTESPALRSRSPGLAAEAVDVAGAGPGCCGRRIARMVAAPR